MVLIKNKSNEGNTRIIHYLDGLPTKRFYEGLQTEPKMGPENTTGEGVEAIE
jgi:hypothetical protein